MTAGDRDDVNGFDLELDETWSAYAFRAITDDDLLRFFAVYQTVGMLG